MPVTPPPVIGDWYRRADRQQPFQVVAIDEAADTIDVEYFDGTVDEWPRTHWRGLEIEPSGAPTDSSGAFDDVDADDDSAPEQARRLLEGDQGSPPAPWRRAARRRGHARRGAPR